MNRQECEAIFAKLSEYLDHELPAPECAELEEHAKDCAPCVEFLESLRKSVRLGKQYEPSEAPAGLSAEVRSRLEEAFRAGKARRDAGR